MYEHYNAYSYSELFFSSVMRINLHWESRGSVVVSTLSWWPNEVRMFCFLIYLASQVKAAKNGYHEIFWGVTLAFMILTTTTIECRLVYINLGLARILNTPEGMEKDALFFW